MFSFLFKLCKVAHWFSTYTMQGATLIFQTMQGGVFRFSKLCKVAHWYSKLCKVAHWFSKLCKVAHWFSKLCKVAFSDFWRLELYLKEINSEGLFKYIIRQFVKKVDFFYERLKFQPSFSNFSKQVLRTIDVRYFMDKLCILKGPSHRIYVFKGRKPCETVSLKAVN